MPCDERVAVAKDICATIKADEAVRRMVGGCTVDDWNALCSTFHLIVELQNLKKGVGKYAAYKSPQERYEQHYYPSGEKWSLRSLTSAINRAVKRHDASLNSIDHPKRMYARLGNRRVFDGYGWKQTSFVIDI